MNYFSAKLISMAQIIPLLIAVGCTNANVQTNSGRDAEWKALFNGKNLDGWQVQGGFAKYQVEDGTIVGTTVKGSPNTFLCTKEQYGDFELEFEVNVDPQLNSGVQIRSHIYKKDITTWVERNNKRVERLRKAGVVYGYQVEISNEQGGASGGIWDESRGAIWLYDASKNPAENKAFKDNKWNKYRVVCVGDWVRTWINGVPCADFRDPADQIGLIGLQVHSFGGKTPAQVSWRNIRIKDMGRHVWKPLFDGKSLEGWHTLPGGQWKVSDGIIEGSNASSEKQHGLLVSDKRYGDFTVRLKFKALKGNSGFYFRADKVGSGVGVHGFQAEIDATSDVGGLYDTGGRGWVVKPDSEEIKKWFKPEQWNQMAVSAHGRRIVVHVNNNKSAELSNDEGRLEGHLAFQLHGGQDVHVMFKDIEILLPKK